MLKNQYKKGLEVGLDEAGRGCLAGPVVAAAVILPKKIFFPELKDSKKTSYSERITLRKKIEKIALDVTVSVVDPYEIDRINILNATIKAMHNSLSKLSIKPTHIIVDGNRFLKYKQIVFNLVSNAIKFTNKGEVSLLFKEKNNELHFIIKDNGIGIPRKLKDIIFKEFDRGSNSKFPGTGLGLYICQNIVEELNGEITVESKENHGSIFEIRIPY